LSAPARPVPAAFDRQQYLAAPHRTAPHRTDLWITRYIFPNSMLPSAAQITAVYEGLFVLEDWHSIGPDYDRTLHA
jgi:cyclopropane fatty-acyl-phospholipid synthase-like methyltransferase